LRAFFFSSRRRHTRCLSDWSSDVCSSDLPVLGALLVNAANTYLNDENLKAWAALALLAAAAGAIPPGVFLARRLQGLRGVLVGRSEEHTSELQSLRHLVCRLLLEKKKDRN